VFLIYLCTFRIFVSQTACNCCWLRQSSDNMLNLEFWRQCLQKKW